MIFLLVWSIGALLGGGVALFAARVEYRKGLSFKTTAKRIADTPRTPVSQVTHGFVHVKGRVRDAGSLLTSPMSKRPCVYYRFLVEELVRQRRGSSVWRPRIDDQQEGGVLVEDAWQGVVEVNVHAADLVLKPDLHAKSGFLNDAPPELDEALRRYGESSQGRLFNKRMRYTETLLEVGDELLVIGTASQQDGKVMLDRRGDIFVVSDLPQEQLIRSFHRKKLSRYFMSGVLALVAGVFWAGVVIAYFAP